MIEDLITLRIPTDDDIVAPGIAMIPQPHKSTWNRHVRNSTCSNNEAIS